MRAESSTSSYLAVDELLRVGAFHPARTHGARAYAPVVVMNNNPLGQPTLSLSLAILKHLCSKLCCRKMKKMYFPGSDQVFETRCDVEKPVDNYADVARPEIFEVVGACPNPNCIRVLKHTGKIYSLQRSVVSSFHESRVGCNVVWMRPTWANSGIER